MNICIIGSGNIAWAFTSAFSKCKGLSVSNYARNRSQLSRLCKKYNTIILGDYKEIPFHTDLVIVCVNDDSIAEVCDQLSSQLKCPVAHTSGSMSIDMMNISKARRACIYPLQSIRIGKEVDFSTVPICLTSHQLKTQQLIKKVALNLSQKLHIIKDADKPKIHICAVLMNNFVNHLAVLSKSYMDKHHLPYEILLPLIEETYRKTGVPPLDLRQTGPAARNDQKLIKKHLIMLEEEKQIQKIYKVITESILHTKSKQS